MNEALSCNALKLVWTVEPSEARPAGCMKFKPSSYLCYGAVTAQPRLAISALYWWEGFFEITTIVHKYINEIEPTFNSYTSINITTFEEYRYRRNFAILITRRLFLLTPAQFSNIHSQKTLDLCAISKKIKRMKQKQHFEYLTGR